MNPSLGKTKESPRLDNFGIERTAPREVAKAVTDYFLKEQRLLLDVEKLNERKRAILLVSELCHMTPETLGEHRHFARASTNTVVGGSG